MFAKILKLLNSPAVFPSNDFPCFVSLPHKYSHALKTVVPPMRTATIWIYFECLHVCTRISRMYYLSLRVLFEIDTFASCSIVRVLCFLICLVPALIWCEGVLLHMLLADLCLWLWEKGFSFNSCTANRIYAIHEQGWQSVSMGKIYVKHLQSSKTVAVNIRKMNCI